jgi:RNA 3'-terminal phosphate cyclase (ATP)
MLTIDGSFGEGGGQIVRSSLALSLVTGTPITLQNIRAKRKRPGLMRQHLTAVRAAAEVGGAEVRGDSVGSSKLEFRPGEVRAGDYHFAIGTAGSTTLVLQTVLPALLTAKGESHLTLEGGTHNPMAPPFDFLAKTYLPLVSRMGPRLEARLERRGFYPAGGGRFDVDIRPAEELGRLDLLERGAVRARRVTAMVANLVRHIAERECRTIAEADGWDQASFEIIETSDSPGPGNALLIEIESEHVTELFSAIGERGVPAEKVAGRALREANNYLGAGVPVGFHLADQLLLPMAIAAHRGTGGGSFRTMALTEHAKTHIELIHKFTGVATIVEQCDGGLCIVRVEEAR